MRGLRTPLHWLADINCDVVNPITGIHFGGQLTLASCREINAKQYEKICLN